MRRNHKNQKVHIVLEFPKDPSKFVRIVEVFSNRDSAWVRAVRERSKDRDGNSYHIIKKSIKGTESEVILTDKGFEYYSLIHRGKK